MHKYACHVHSERPLRYVAVAANTLGCLFFKRCTQVILVLVRGILISWPSSSSYLSQILVAFGGGGAAGSAATSSAGGLFGSGGGFGLGGKADPEKAKQNPFGSAFGGRTPTTTQSGTTAGK